MSDAFRCNGCGEYADEAFRLLEIEMQTDVVRVADITLDDIPTAAFGLLEDDCRGDFCPSCGRKALQALVSLFDGEGGVRR